jgi:hypothetical protein
LIRRSAFVTRTREDLASHRQQRGIIVELAARGASQRPQGVAKERVRLWGHLEREKMRAWVWVANA